MSYMIPSKGALLPGSPHRAPIERHAPFILLFFILVFSSIINQSLEIVSSHSHSNKVIGNCTLLMWWWTPLLWQLLEMWKHKT